MPFDVQATSSFGPWLGDGGSSRRKEVGAHPALRRTASAQQPSCLKRRIDALIAWETVFTWAQPGCRVMAAPTLCKLLSDSRTDRCKQQGSQQQRLSPSER